MCGTKPSGGYDISPPALLTKKKKKTETQASHRRNYLGEWDFRSTETILFTKKCFHCAVTRHGLERI